jgi:protein-L-isoaspartate(D-aspartate) O-methyltransferase
MDPLTQVAAFSAQRQLMVESQLRARGIRDERVLRAMAHVPRHQFVDPVYWGKAYQDHPLPIGHGQTISQPYIVAVMLEVLALEPTHEALEIGTGSGYTAALLAELTAHVYSVERHQDLARAAGQLLKQLGYGNVTVLVGDGSEGLPAAAPFDAILVSAAALQLPPALFEQLKEGGRMAIPVGPPEAQELQFVRKQGGQAVITVIESCRFVPLVGS